MTLASIDQLIRRSLPLLQTHGASWVNHAKSRVLVLLQACFRLLRKLSLDGLLQREVQMDVVRNMAAAFVASIWPVLNPVSNINRMLCYEFHIVRHTEEFSWAM